MCERCNQKLPWNNICFNYASPLAICRRCHNLNYHANSKLELSDYYFLDQFTDAVTTDVIKEYEKIAGVTSGKRSTIKTKAIGTIQRKKYPSSHWQKLEETKKIQDEKKKRREKLEEQEKKLRAKARKLEADRKGKVKKLTQQLESKLIAGFSEASIRKCLEEENWAYQKAFNRIKDSDQANKRQRDKQQRAITTIISKLSSRGIEVPSRKTLRKMLADNRWVVSSVLEIIDRSHRKNNERRKQIWDSIKRKAEGHGGNTRKHPTDNLDLALWLDEKFDQLEENLSNVSTRLGNLELLTERLDELAYQLNNVTDYLELIDDSPVNSVLSGNRQDNIEDDPKDRSEDAVVDKSLNIVRLNFEILQPGRWKPQDVINHYRRLAEQYPAEFQAQRIQWGRIKEIQNLNHVNTYKLYVLVVIVITQVVFFRYYLFHTFSYLRLCCIPSTHF